MAVYFDFQDSSPSEVLEEKLGSSVLYKMKSIFARDEIRKATTHGAGVTKMELRCRV